MTELYAVEIDRLVKRYGQFEALRGLDLRIPRGSIFGFLGKNGAGKTTTIKIMLGMSRATSGEIRVLGSSLGDPNAGVVARSRIGFVSEEKDLYDHMSVDEMLRFTARFYPRWREDRQEKYLRLFGLARERRIGRLSRGERAKAALVSALCRGADLLILDEPTRPASIPRPPTMCWARS